MDTIDLAYSCFYKHRLLAWTSVLSMDTILLWKLSLDTALGIVYGQSLDLALSFVMEIVS